MGYFDDQSDDSLVSDAQLSSTVQAVQQLQNVEGAGVGSIFPPKLQGGTSIPTVTGLKVSSVTSLGNGVTSVTLTWINPEGYEATISSYNIYVTQAVSTNQAPQQVASSGTPASFTFTTASVNTCVFTVQTVLRNGQTSPVGSSPTCTVTSTSPTISPASLNLESLQITGLTLTSNSPGGGSIAWSACTIYYKGITYSVSGSNTASKYVFWTVGNSTFTTSTTYVPSVTSFLIATNCGGTADLAWNKVASGGIAGGHLNMPSLYNGPNGSLLIQDFTFTNNTPGATSVTWSAGTCVYKGITYSVAGGNTANTWIYWQLSSPTVFQTAASYPTLGADDFLIGINNSNNTPATQGFFSQCIEQHDATNERSFMQADNLTGYNKEANFAYSLGRTAGDSVGTPAAGTLRLANGTGAGGLGSGQTIILSGIDGRMQCTDIITSGGPSFQVQNLSGGGVGPTINDTLTIVLNGSLVEIPCHS